MNIIINSNCNKKCSFCFENSNFKNKIENMSLDTFKNVCNWICHSHSKNNTVPIQILGGEPALHPQLDEMLNYLIELRHFGYNIDACLITNGYNIEKYLPKLDTLQSRILLNISSMNDSDDEIINKIKNVIGYNCYLTASFAITNESILPLLTKVTNSFTEKELLHFRPSAGVVENATEGFYEENKKYVLEAYKFLHENNRTITTDCFKIPLCYYTKEEIQELKSYNILAINDNYLGAVCNPYSTDILPDGTFVSCMPMFNKNEKKMYFYEFNNCEEVHLYMRDFLNREAVKKFDNIEGHHCKECIEYKTLRCFGGCLGMKVLPKQPNNKEIYPQPFKPKE